MENIVKGWETLASKQAWLRKSADQFLRDMNAELAGRNIKTGSRIVYTLATWKEDRGDGCYTDEHKITVDLTDYGLEIYHTTDKDNYDRPRHKELILLEDKNDYRESMAIADIRLLASKMSEILTFFERETAKRNGELDAAITIFDRYTQEPIITTA